MSLIKLNNRAVKDVTQFGSISQLGSLTHISTATASSSASIEFTSGIDSTYKEYVFYFVNMHPANGGQFQFNLSSDSGSNYNVTKTTTSFRAYHHEGVEGEALEYETNRDLAQSTGFQILTTSIGNDNDKNLCGSLQLFNPSSTTYVKHFISQVSTYSNDDYNYNNFTAGYGNTTSAINAIKFQMSSGNIDAGEILLFGIN